MMAWWREPDPLTGRPGWLEILIFFGIYAGATAVVGFLFVLSRLLA